MGRRKVKAHSFRTNVHSINFSVCGFCACSQNWEAGAWDFFLWAVPCQVVLVQSDFVFGLNDLLQRKTGVVHIRRPLLYRTSRDGTEAHDDFLRAAEHPKASYPDIKALHHNRRKDNATEILVEYEELPDKVHFTWKSPATLSYDVPEFTVKFLRSLWENRLNHRAIEQCLHSWALCSKISNSQKPLFHPALSVPQEVF